MPVDTKTLKLLHNKGSIPRVFSLWVKLPGNRRFYDSFVAATERPSHPHGPWKMMLAGTFKFQPSDSATTQLFAVPHHVTDSWADEGFSTDGIVVQFHTNWGDPKATCIYGLRVHGVPLE